MRWAGGIEARLRLGLGIVSLCTGVACGVRPGLGPHTGTPLGTAFEWPSGIFVNSSITGESGPDCTPDVELASGGLVAPCFRVGSSSSQDQLVTLPPRLTFVSRNEAKQNGILLESVFFSVPAEGTVTVRLALYSLNQHREPSGPSDLYTLGSLTSDAGLEDLASVLVGRFQVNAAVLVQSAVWQVTDGTGLTQTTRDELQTLPAS